MNEEKCAKRQACGQVEDEADESVVGARCVQDVSTTRQYANPFVLTKYERVILWTTCRRLQSVTIFIVFQ